jgi:GTP:adenosylcobinamide-phosphate guanylyltransferase
MAGGFAGEFPGENHAGDEPAFKAFLPVNGRPIADYVVQALEQSEVEKIFIVHDEGASLKETLSPCSKGIFFSRAESLSSLGMGGFFALEKVAEYYGEKELINKKIMVVPCDIPSATKDNFNRLIRKAASNQADVTLAMIAVKRLAERYPKKYFRGVYLSDRKATFTMQSVLFIDGGFIQFDPSGIPGKQNLLFRGWDKNVFIRVKNGLDSIDGLRRQPFFLNKIFLLWLLTKGYTSFIVKLLVDLALKRLTTDKVVEYLNGADHLRAAFIESEEVELSGDIDRPEDFQTVLGIPWQKGG